MYQILPMNIMNLFITQLCSLILLISLMNFFFKSKMKKTEKKMMNLKKETKKKIMGL
uniref:ATP synthase subunit 8 n=1 Tax=Bregmatothrips sinensis TaxID=3045418 RepID=UPI0030E187D6